MFVLTFESLSFSKLKIFFSRTDANNQINNVLSKLTALGTVLVPVRGISLASTLM